MELGIEALKARKQNRQRDDSDSEGSEERRDAAELQRLEIALYSKFARGGESEGSADEFQIGEILKEKNENNRQMRKMKEALDARMDEAERYFKQKYIKLQHDFEGKLYQKGKEMDNTFEQKITVIEDTIEDNVVGKMIKAE